MSISLNNLSIGNVLLKINECESTNIFAKELLSKNEPIDGTVVFTDKQTKGRGQYGNKWQANSFENLTFSVILKPKFLKPKEQFLLSKIISLACINVLNTYKKDSFSIKWPNDIFYNEKKIGGILIENIISSHQINTSIIGVGLNINQKQFEGLEQAISLKNILQKNIDLKEVLNKILKQLDFYYQLLRKRKIEQINALYLKNMLGINTFRFFIKVNSQTKFNALIKGVNTEGKLHLQKNDKDLFFGFKQLVWCYSN